MSAPLALIRVLKTFTECAVVYENLCGSVRLCSLSRRGAELSTKVIRRLSPPVDVSLLLLWCQEHAQRVHIDSGEPAWVGCEITPESLLRRKWRLSDSEVVNRN